MTVGTASTVILTVGSERAVVSCAGVMAVSVLTAVAPRAGLSVAMRAVTMTEPEATDVLRTHARGTKELGKPALEDIPIARVKV